MGVLILIFGLNLIIGSPYYQGRRIRSNFRLLECFLLRWYSWESNTSLTKHSAQSFCTGSDDPAKQCWSALRKSGWSGLSLDDPDLDFCERLEEARPDDPALHRMIRIWEFWVCFCLFCHDPGWSEITPDDPGTTRKHTTVTFESWSIYTLSPPSFTYLSLSPRPTTPPKH